MAQQNTFSKSGLASAKLRIGMLIGGVVVAAVVAVGVWHHYRSASIYQGQVDVTGAPIGIHNTPGATDASDNYIATQNAQNAKLSREAKDSMTSAVPTITRASFMDNTESFQASANQAGAQACPLNDSANPIRPNPASCTADNLRLARESGVKAIELRCQACGCPALRAAGYAVGELRDSGFAASELKQCGFDLTQLITAGFSANELKQAGFAAATLRNAGMSAGELAAAGFSDKELKQAGFSKQELAAAGAIAKATAPATGTGACSVAALREARAQGASPVALKNRGCDLATMRAAGFTAAEMKAAGYNAADILAAGYGAKEMRDAGYSAAELVKAGVSAAELRKAGFTASQLKNAGVSAAALKAAGFNAADLKKAGFSAKELQRAGYTAGELRSAGVSAAELKAAGFSAKDLHDAGFSASDLKQAGLTPEELAQAGYTKGDMVRAGFSAAQAGYVAPVVTTTAAPVDTGAATTVASTIPSIQGDSSTQQLRKLQEAQQAMMTQQQRQDAVQQMQGQMMMQATKMMQGWSNTPVQKSLAMIEPPAGANSAANAVDAASKMKGPTIKAGTIMYGVLDTAINSDEVNTPVMATIVSGELKGAKLVGQFTRVDKKVLLNFNVVNVPSFSKSFAANVVAIDPNTARTAMAGYVDNHYLLRFGSLFASAFLSGISQGITQSNATTNCLGPICTTQYGNLRPSDYLWMGAGRVGEQYSSNMASNFNRPPTVQVPGGVGLGLLFMADSVLPEPLPTSTEGGQ